MQLRKHAFSQEYGYEYSVSMKTINIALVGVGGQGTLLASEVVSRAAMLGA